MLAALVLHNLFGRFPNVNVLSIENGCAWLAPLLTQLDHSVALARNGRWLGGKFDDLPSDILRDHLWVSPFPEEDPIALAGIIGTERVLFGSDWPHPEGLERPLDFAEKLSPLEEATVRKIMRGNFAGLFGLAP
jgi:predicted TIM-barrel fold metal-dependent hydrolase